VLARIREARLVAEPGVRDQLDDRRDSVARQQCCELAVDFRQLRRVTEEDVVVDRRERAARPLLVAFPRGSRRPATPRRGRFRIASAQACETAGAFSRDQSLEPVVNQRGALAHACDAFRFAQKVFVDVDGRAHVTFERYIV
jgi:hypothetical protein